MPNEIKVFRMLPQAFSVIQGHFLVLLTAANKQVRIFNLLSVVQLLKLRL